MAAKTICPLGTCWSFICQKLTYKKLFMGERKEKQLMGNYHLFLHQVLASPTEILGWGYFKKISLVYFLFACRVEELCVALRFKIYIFFNVLNLF